MDVSRLLPLIQRVLTESNLQELEMLQPLIGLDFSRQLSLRRLAIDTSMLSLMPQLTELDELALTNVDSSLLGPLKGMTYVDRLTLTGEFHAIYDCDQSQFPRFGNLIIEVSSHESTKARSSRGTLLSTSILTSRATALAYPVDDSWTNETLAASICPGNATTTDLQMAVAPAALKWFPLPSCVSSFTALSNLACTNCIMPDFRLFTSVPLVSIQIMNCKGAMTQKMAETDLGANGDYFDWSWLPNMPNLTYLNFNASIGNATLPNHLTTPILSTFGLTSQLGLSGTIAPDFFRRYPSLGYIALYGTLLTGTIPYSGIEQLRVISIAGNNFTHWPSIVTNSSTGFGFPSFLGDIDLSHNPFLSEIPSEAQFQAMRLNFLDLNGVPLLSGPLPNIFASTVARDSIGSLVRRISAHGSGFSGTLPEIPSQQLELYYGYSPALLTIDVGGNQLSGSIPTSWSNMSFVTLDLSGNPGLGGSLATIDSNGKITSQFIRTAATLYLDSPGFTGPMFNLSSMQSLTTLVVQAPNVDYCASARAAVVNGTLLFPSAMTSCSLTNSNATDCFWAFPSVCRVGAVVPTSTPVATPVSTPTASPIATVPSIEPSPCPLPSPGPLFICSGSNWVSNGSVTVVTIVIPASSTTIVNGNLTTSTVVIASITSTVNVSGCITTPDGDVPPITLTLSQEDLEKIVKNGGSLTSLLISQGSNCTSLTSAPVVVDTSGIKSCKTIKTDSIGNSRGLSVTFSVNTSKCNVWWIVVVSVVCVVVIGAVVVTGIVCVVVKNRKHGGEKASLERSQAYK